MAEAAAGRVKVRKAKAGKKRRGLLAGLCLLACAVTPVLEPADAADAL